MITCVDVPALPLQLVLRTHPEWSSDPVVVVEDDRPQAPILWANRPARDVRIYRGTTFAQARALSTRLHAEVVEATAIDAAIDELFELLTVFSPRVEPVLVQPGLFWLDPSGLDGLFGSNERWARRVHERVAAERYVAAVVVGFRRASAFAIARMRTGSWVSADAVQEQRLAERVPLGLLGIDPKLIEALDLLEVRTVGQLLALPVSQLRVRYGAEAAQLHDFLAGRSWTPLLPRDVQEPLVLELEIDPPDDDQSRLLFGLRAALVRTADDLAARCQALTALELRLKLDHAGAHCERIETAAPTLDVAQVVDLLRLRLANVELAAPVEHISVTLEHTRVHPRQIELARGEQRRDLEAASRALARLRASFGPTAVTRARLCDAHLPEAGFRFEPVTEVKRPTPTDVAQPPLVRRVYPRPLLLPPLPTHEPEAWLGTHGAVEAMHGPYRIAGGWWTRRRERDYYFVQTQKGEILWVYYDRPRRRWLLHGLVD